MLQVDSARSAHYGYYICHRMDQIRLLPHYEKVNALQKKKELRTAIAPYVPY